MLNTIAKTFVQSAVIGGSVVLGMLGAAEAVQWMRGPSKRERRAEKAEKAEKAEYAAFVKMVKRLDDYEAPKGKKERQSHKEIMRGTYGVFQKYLENSIETSPFLSQKKHMKRAFEAFLKSVARARVEQEEDAEVAEAEGSGDAPRGSRAAPRKSTARAV
jgi:hypothetical protein